MPKRAKTRAKADTKARIVSPGKVLQLLLHLHKINGLKLAKAINISYPTLNNILHDKQKISVSTAFRLAKYFSVDPYTWIDIQIEADVMHLSRDKKFVAELKKIVPLKYSEKTKKDPKPKTGKRKTKTLAEKRKKAAKTARGRPAKKGQRGKTRRK